MNAMPTHYSPGPSGCSPPTRSTRFSGHPRRGAVGHEARVLPAAQTTALEMLESLLRYYVQGTQRVDEQDARLLLQQTPTGDPIMQTFIDRYIEQGRQQGIEQGIEQGEANVLLRLITKKFGPPSKSVRERIAAADADTLLHWSERILTADSLEAVLH
jgi:hypothetical protein